MALIKCSECGNTISDKALKCPKCGTPTVKEEGRVEAKVAIVEESSMANENVPIVEPTPTKNKNILIIIICLIIMIAIILGIINYCIGGFSNESNAKISNRESISTTNETASQEIAKPTKLLTGENITRTFLQIWKQHRADRKLIPLEGCNEGYKIIFGDLNNDGVNDAIVNAYVTPSAKEISNNDYDDKSYIFCFLNDNGYCKLVSSTQLNRVFFVDKIDNGEIFSHCFTYIMPLSNGDEISEKEEYRFRFDGDKLIGNGAEDEDKATNHKENFNENDFDLEEGCFYSYEGDMGGFPIKVGFCVLDGIVEGEYQNVKYGTVLKLTGQLNSDKRLHITGENQKEKVVFKLSYSSPEYLNGHGMMGDNSLKVKLKQISNEVINDSN